MIAESRSHILVVEANDVTRKLIIGILNNKGYETYEATNGDEAVNFLAKKPLLVILDVEGENVDNIGFIRKMQMEHRKVPLVAMLEGADRESVRARLDMPNVSFLEKPVMPNTLLENIEGHLMPGVEEAIRAEEEAKFLPETVAATAEVQAQREGFMRRAIDLSQIKMDENCGGPFGAVIVRAGKIIAEGWNCVTSTNDPTAHAEMVAIRAAAKEVGDFTLEGCEIYTSCEPCPMCLAAIYWARLDRMFYANMREDAERIGFDDAFLYNEISLPEHKRQLPTQRMLREEARIVFDNWMKKPDKTDY
ncbi:MAG: response regulator [Alphaproteobacteria bacterium]|nr:response regulator [Alphaproteobacteria bacterium]